VVLNCAALPAELVEAELFCVEKDAYTGAHAQRIGRFARAGSGTLLLGEVGEVPLAAQTKPLRVLQLGEIERVVGEATRKVNARLVAATDRDLNRTCWQDAFGLTCSTDSMCTANLPSYPVRKTQTCAPGT
jgi:transcriptional regulator with GAF, ATPase, and Fis domain